MEADLRQELPYRAEYAKSGRSACKTCKSSIGDKSLRMAVMVKSPFFDGMQANWHHYECFFKKFRPKNGAEIAHFAQLRYEDQKRIEKSISESLGVAAPADTTDKKRRKRKSDNNDETVSSNAASKYGDFKVEYAKSNRSKCRLCENTIKKKDIRIAKLDRESDDARRFGPLDRWFHVECFVTGRQSLQYYASAKSIPQFDQLEPNDQNMLKKKIPEIEEPKTESNDTNGDEVPPTKKPKKQSNSEEKALKKQSDLIFKYQDHLDSLRKPELLELLEHNHIAIPDSNASKIERLADSMAFGCTDKCPECSGQLVFRISGYICTGMANEWAKCDYQTDKPKRVPFKIPDELKQKYDFLTCYKYAKKDRLYVASLQEAIKSTANTSTQNAVLPKPEASASSTKVLSNYKVVTVGKLKTAKNQLKSRIEKLGGQLAASIDRTILCVISNKNEVEKETSKIMQSKDLGIPVVSEDFLDAAENGTNLEQAITINLICDWIKDIDKRVANLNVNEKMKTAMKSGMSSGSGRFASSGPSIQKMVIKEGNVVDPESELEDVAHVCKDGSDVYNAILNNVDLTTNKNSYYKIQLLEHDNKKKYWVFRSWGRVGTNIGGTKVDNFSSKSAAIQSFKDVYFERTENNWDDRSNFVKRPNCYFPVDIDYGGNDQQLMQLQPGKSVLPKSIQELICMIFDVQQMKQAMLEFEIDLEKMPLGKLSKKQLISACSVLKEISNAIESKSANNTKLVGLANKFYTLVPHNFGVDKLPLIDNKEAIATKMEMLEALLDIEMAYEMRSSIDANEDKDPIDLHYEKLSTTLEMLDKSEGMYDVITTYLRNTHARTHMIKLDILEVFRVERHGEYDRYKKFKDLDNRMLLWHGSRVTNYAGILSQGLRIAPPEAPVTGYMFGKGIYFADMVTKSANYCHPYNNNNIGLLLLSEVAVGVPYELTEAKDVKKPPSKKHSVKGCGKTEPDPNEVFVTEDGVKVPYGKPVDRKDLKASLLYNEYIVYDSEQVNLKYLVMVKFNN